jgi:molecular chaperone GrpE (heat shock protein)
MSDINPSVLEKEVSSETIDSVAAEENEVIDNSNAEVSLPEQGKASEAINEEEQDTNQSAAQLEILISNQEKAEGLLREILSQTQYAVQFAEKKQEQIDKLYSENQEYKQGIHEKFKKSLVLAVIEQIDAALKTISHFGEQEFSAENYCKLLGNYREIATDFQNSLVQSFDVAAFYSEEDMPFDAKRQRALKTVPTEDAAKHKLVSKSIRPGYEVINPDGTRTLLRPEMVEVYVHQSQQS